MGAAPLRLPFDPSMNTEGAVQCFRLKKLKDNKGKCNSKPSSPTRRFHLSPRACIRCSPR
ncbi:protein of unknown function [Paraburkholderia dioscoreae]|uniref:Uncharacterized protein n=1 Tax=Paraburkholderia dioscoreae TaxID=2604047 RepID=A0A5Q4ZLT9_9BURK|nr:protein of unknown function [Paraburkholderia dioscoreae]